MMLKWGTSALAPRIPFWIFATEICGLCQPDAKVQLTAAQRALWKSYDRQVALDATEAMVYTQMTGLEPWTPGERVPPFMQLVLSRGAGKSLLLATIAVYEAVTNPYQAAPGETVAVVALAPRKKQAADMLRYAAAHLQRPSLAPFVARAIKEEIVLQNGRFLRIQAVDKSGGAARGPTYITSLFDESAFLSCDGVIIDAEQWQAILAGARGVSDFRGIMSSTPNGKSGFFWETFDTHHKHPGKSWQCFLGPQPIIRPDMDPALLDEFKRSDPEAFEREFLCSFDAAGTERFFDSAHVHACVQKGLQSVPPRGPHVQYVAAVDPTGGAHDWMTLSVVERAEDGSVRQCLTRGWDPTIQGAPTVHDIAREIATLIAPYGIRTVYGDIFGGAWVAEAFAAVGIVYETRGFNSSHKLQRASLLRELFAARHIVLLDEPIQTRELIEYERKTTRTGLVSVNKPLNAEGSDDYLDALALSVWELVGNDIKLHPPEVLDKWDPKAWKKDLFGGAYPDTSPEQSDTISKIEAKGEGPAWVVHNWMKDWRYCQCSLGELAWLCGVGPNQMAQVIGRNLVLQLCWLRWILSYKRADVDIILKAHFVGIPGFEEVKTRIAAAGTADGVVTYGCVGADAWAKGRLPFDWQPLAVKSVHPTRGVSTADAFPPWTRPLPEWRLQHDVEAIYGGWPDRPWASEIEKTFRTRRRYDNRQNEARIGW